MLNLRYYKIFMSSRFIIYRVSQVESAFFLISLLLKLQGRLNKKTSRFFFWRLKQVKRIKIKQRIRELRQKVPLSEWNSIFSIDRILSRIVILNNLKSKIKKSFFSLKKNDLKLILEILTFIKILKISYYIIFFQ